MGITIIVVYLLNHFQLFAILWTEPTMLLCPWDFPGKNTGVVVISFSRASSQSRYGTCLSCLAGRLFTNEPPGKPYNNKTYLLKIKYIG